MCTYHVGILALVSTSRAVSTRIRRRPHSAECGTATYRTDPSVPVSLTESSEVLAGSVCHSYSSSLTASHHSRRHCRGIAASTRSDAPLLSARTLNYPTRADCVCLPLSASDAHDKTTHKLILLLILSAVPSPPSCTVHRALWLERSEALPHGIHLDGLARAPSAHPPIPPPLWIDWRAPTPSLRPVDTPGTARGTEPVRRGPPRRAAGVTVA